MTGKKEAAPVPSSVQQIGEPFSLGVDVRGLVALANKLYGYVPSSEDIVNRLKKTINQLISDAGWIGEDANTFLDAWDNDLHDAGKLTMFIEAVAEIVDNLASSMSELQLWFNSKIPEIKGIHPGQMSIMPNSRVLGSSQGQALIDSVMHRSYELQRKAASDLSALFSGSVDKWAITRAAKARSKDPNLPSSTRNAFSGIEDELDDTLPDGAFPWREFLTWTTAGAGTGSAVGSAVGGIGAVPGLVVGTVVGAMPLT